MVCPTVLLLDNTLYLPAPVGSVASRHLPADRYLQCAPKTPFRLHAHRRQVVDVIVIRFTLHLRNVALSGALTKITF